MVVVGKKWDRGAEYVGRPSPLGNPFVMNGERTRDEVCDKYEAWLRSKIATKDPAVCAELNRLYKIAKQRDLILGCYCAPKRCHAESIKKVIDAALLR